MAISSLKNSALKAIQNAQNLKELESAYKAYTGKKGELTLLLRSLVNLSPAERKTQGKAANDLRDFLEERFRQRKQEIQNTETAVSENAERIDVTAPGKWLPKGHLHPLTLVQRKAQEIFRAMGFAIAQGPEIETEWYNFDALNIPVDHPARDMWDTFWLKAPKNTRYLLRTHTSPVQIRYMETHNPPLRVIAPGTTYRYEATDARHEFQLIQLEGLLIDKRVSAANFIAVIQEFYRQFFEKSVSIRLRPSYFPFTEPSFEVDMSCLMCGGKGCASCGHAGWMEMMGAGMVHPHVFKAAGYIPGQWTGFAFGMGLDRLAMMKYKIPDIRMFRAGDLRFIQQF